MLERDLKRSYVGLHFLFQIVGYACEGSDLRP